MKSIVKHVTEQPFIAATAVAALLHSTWALGTLFAGNQPPAGFTIEFIGWLAPALLIAFSLDIGLLATSHEIRIGQRSRAKYATFITLALSMYYLQWTYMIHHVPALALAAGVAPTWIELSTTLRDLAIWLIPALLPLSTLLYTFSHTEPQGSAMMETRGRNAQEGNHAERKPAASITIAAPGKARDARSMWGNMTRRWLNRPQPNNGMPANRDVRRAELLAGMESPPESITETITETTEAPVTPKAAKRKDRRNKASRGAAEPVASTNGQSANGSGD